MPRADKASRYPDVVKWRKLNPERNLVQNRGDQETYRGKPGSRKRREYNAAQYLRAVRRRAKKAAEKALALAKERAAMVARERIENGYAGTLRPNGL